MALVVPHESAFAPMLYSAYQALTDCLTPWQQAASLTTASLREGRWMGATGVSQMAAACEVFARLKLTHSRPSFGIDSVTVAQGVEAHAVPVTERVMQTRAFGTLLRFERADVDRAGDSGHALPKVLIVAPLSGHFATLLADTARTMLADHDVYITDWHNARMVPLSEGVFGLSDYVDHVIGFIEALGPHTHLLAVCQPCVPVLAAVALMAQRGSDAQPRSMTLMAGPIDCRVNPTQVNEMAVSKPIDWFARNLVHTVPLRYPGAMRRVYPGFLQLSAFVAMNPERHKSAFKKLYAQRIAGEHDQAEATVKFYDEYFAVNDLPAEFYLETVAQVFQEYTLARGEFEVHGERIDTGAIRRTALFTVEGERDDICAIGQTVAAHDLCSGIKPWMKHHHVQLGVGHYGVFSGRRWREQIYPRVREMIHAVD
jgi:poly(3-hydroxybutyrate) depolymerase